MRRLIYSLLAAYWAFCLLAYARLPARVPVHFGLRGEPDRWSDDPLIAWFMLPAIGTLTVLLVMASGKLARSAPEFWNVPEKQRFLALTKEQREPIVQHLLKLLDIAALYALAVVAVVQISVYESALSAEGQLGWLFHTVMWGGLIVLLIYALRLNAQVKRMILQAGDGATGRVS